jgi:hypothetical protein
LNVLLKDSTSQRFDRMLDMVWFADRSSVRFVFNSYRTAFTTDSFQNPSGFAFREGISLAQAERGHCTPSVTGTILAFLQIWSSLTA